MSKAAEYVKVLGKTLAERPAFILPTPNGPAVVAYVDLVAGQGNGSVTPVITIERCTLNPENFAELVGWAAAMFNDKEGE